MESSFWFASARPRLGRTGYAAVHACRSSARSASGPCGVVGTQLVLSVAKPERGLRDWHVRSVPWTAPVVTTYLDGQLIGTQPVYEDTFDQPMCFAISAARAIATLEGNRRRPAFIEAPGGWFRVC